VACSENTTGIELAQQRNEFRHAKAVMADLHDMPQPAAVDLARQQVEEGTEVGRVELLRRRELPEHRAELVAEFEHA
jgi:hypothetical protein